MDKLILTALAIICVAPKVIATNCTYVRTGSRIVSADCSHLGWTQIPADLPPTLISLDMSGNRLNSLSGRPLCRLPVLESLDLSQNQISQLENSSFSGLSRLRWLSLRGNQLRMTPATFPSGTFQDLVSLRYLDMHLNQPFDQSRDLAYPDVALSALADLQELKMDGLVTNVDLGLGFAKLQKLEVLDINDDSGHCYMTSLSETFFLHINTSRPLTVNLTMCQLQSIHRNTFSFLPTLHILDLFANRHLNLPPFMEASRSLWRTPIKVLNISYIHRDTKIMLKAEYFQYLGYTWLETLVVSNVEAYYIELGAMFNLPTSLKYLSFYDNNLIDATFLLGLYLLPNMETLQISRQNHFSSQILTLTNNDTDARLRTSAGSDQKIGARNPQLFDILKPYSGTQGKPTELHFSPENSLNISRKSFKSLLTRSSKDSQSTRFKQHNTQEKYSDSSTKHRIPLSLTVETVTGSSSPEINRTFHENSEQEPVMYGKKLDHNISSPSHAKIVPADQRPHRQSGLSKSEMPSDWTDLPISPFDPTVCTDAQFKRHEESRWRKVVQQIKLFLSDHNFQFQNLSQLSLNNKQGNETSLRDILVAVNMTLKNDGHAKTYSHRQERSSKSDNLPDLPDIILPFPPSIRFFYGSELKLGYSLPEFHFLDNRVEILNISRNSLHCFIGPWLGLNKLQSFDLSRNFAIYLSQEFFENMPSLTHLYLQRNFLGESFANDTGGRIFKNLTNLQVLNLNDNSIKYLSEAAFQGQQQLVHLSVARNALSLFKPRLAHLSGLTFLDLSDNSIQFLHHELMEDLDNISTTSNLTVNLQRNPLSCGCDSLDFWYWVKGKTSVSLHKVNEYMCKLENGSMIGYSVLTRELGALWIQCQGKTFLSIALGMLVALLFLLSVLGVLHYKRWRLRYFYYVGLRGYRHPYNCHSQTHDRTDIILRDVFISFDDDSGDLQILRFVHDVLKPELDRRGLTYYTSEVEFAGRPIKDFIPDAILGARKTLALFTSHFFPSYERELEFNMAVYHEEEIHRRVIVPVFMEPADLSSFPKEVMVYLDDHPCISFQKDKQEHFMNTLADRIRSEIRI